MRQVGMERIITRLKEKAHEIGISIGLPVFYSDMAAHLNISESLAESDAVVGYARSIIREKGDVLGHGYHHAHRVAIEAGAIINAECDHPALRNRLVTTGLIAGYMHDLKRDEPDHPGKAALALPGLFTGRIEEREIEMISFAIRNHEAFKKHEVVGDEDLMLLANSLYDADKFRWGPDNFVYTVWDMLESRNIPPGVIFANYEKGVEGIKRIKNTFRTPTGNRYGPDFIDRGIEIGERLCEFYKTLAQ